MQQALDKLNEEIRNARLNKTAESSVIATTTLSQQDDLGRITATTVAAPMARQLGDDYDHVEVIHFHGNSQCSSCRAVGAYAEETVNTYFSDELKSGKLLFGHVNYDLPENKALAEKYGVTGSSLWIGTYKGGKFYPEENTNVWYKINDKADYLNYLKGVIVLKLI